MSEPPGRTDGRRAGAYDRRSRPYGRRVGADDRRVGAAGENLASARVVRERLAGRGLRPKRSLGQNFLVDANIVRKIADAAGVGPGDTVLEIGPGLGALTQELSARGARVVAIEVDPELVTLLRDGFAEDERVEIVQADALQADYGVLLADARTADGRSVDGGAVVEGAAGGHTADKHTSGGHTSDKHTSGGHTSDDAGDGLRPPPQQRLKVAANLPYYITTPLVFRLLETVPFSTAVLMVQREVADRIAAPPGSKAYGALSVGVQAECDVELVASVPPTVFLPRPDVSSAVLRLRRSASPAFPREAGSTFRAVVRAAFAHRRKTLKRSLAHDGDALGLSAEQIDPVLRRAEIDGTRRAEQLSVAEYARLAASVAAYVGRAPSSRD